MRRDRRRSARVELCLPLRGQRTGDAGREPWEGLLENLSCGGILMSVDEPLPVGTRLVVELSFPRPAGAPLLVRTRVARVTRSPVGRCYRVAGEFEGLGPEDCFTFADFVAARL